RQASSPRGVGFCIRGARDRGRFATRAVLTRELDSRMPIVEFDTLPPDARVWVFSANSALSEPSVHVLITEVDIFLESWKAHGHPLRAARDFRDQRFLAVGVDQSTEGASGCSIDGLFRTLQGLETRIDAVLLPGGRIFWRDTDGSIRGGTRA